MNLVHRKMIAMEIFKKILIIIKVKINYKMNNKTKTV